MKQIFDLKQALPIYLARNEQLGFDEISKLVKAIEFLRQADTVSISLLGDFLEFCTFEETEMSEQQCLQLAEKIQSLPKPERTARDLYVLEEADMINRRRHMKP